MADSVEVVDRSTWIAGDLRAAPTSLLVLAALTLTNKAGGARPDFY